MSHEEIVAAALHAGDEGLTLLGGEPFDQARGLAVLAEAARRDGLGVIVFSGYTRDQLMDDHDSRRVLEATDLLVDGPYRRDDPERERALVGSRNQKFHHLTSRYIDYNPTARPNRVDVRLGPDGSLEVAGFLDTNTANLLREALEVRRTPRVTRMG